MWIKTANLYTETVKRHTVMITGEMDCAVSTQSAPEYKHFV